MVKEKEAGVLVYQMKSMLDYIEPVIWQRFYVRGDVTLLGCISIFR